MTQPFRNPYITPNGALKQHHRVMLFVGNDDWQFIKGSRLETGTVTITLSILFNKLANELSKRGLNDLSDSKTFERLVANCEIKLPV